MDPSTLQSYQHLIQWVTNLALHVLASVPEYKHRKGPGVSTPSFKLGHPLCKPLTLQSDLIAEKNNLNMMRELLFIIRLWGRTNEGILPSYTKTAESFDVLAKLFSLLTR